MSITAAANPTVVLEARKLALSYPRKGEPGTAVLADFSLQLVAGEVVAVLGPSGVGKSSLLRVLAGLQPADSGELAILGRPLDGPHPRLSFVFQDPCLLPWLTLEANVGFGLNFKYQPRIAATERSQRVNDAISEVGLDEALGQYPAALSGGMAQRVALARALARRPEILLLDEPFSALDEITRSEMQSLLRRVTTNHHAAAVLVTHDIDEALAVADRILLIGGYPARVMHEWIPTSAYPRDEASLELTQIRVEIVRTMRHARAGTANTHTDG